MALPLLKEGGVGSLLLENPFCIHACSLCYVRSGMEGREGVGREEERGGRGIFGA